MEHILGQVINSNYFDENSKGQVTIMTIYATGNASETGAKKTWCIGQAMVKRSSNGVLEASCDAANIRNKWKKNNAKIWWERGTNNKQNSTYFEESEYKLEYLYRMFFGYGTGYFFTEPDYISYNE